MERLHGKHSMTGAKNPLVVKFADAKNKDSNDSQVVARDHKILKHITLRGLSADCLSMVGFVGRCKTPYWG